MTTPATGVVVMSYGTPARTEEIPEYYTHIRRGNPPTPEQLANLVGRYEALGGVSTLRERTQAQRTQLAGALDAQSPGGYRVVVGQRHASPFIADAVTQLAQPTDGTMPCARIIGLVLAPHYSGFSVGHYSTQLHDAAERYDIEAITIPHWYDLPEYTDFLANSVRESLAQIDAPRDETLVVFTAHSLPERLLVDDPYVEQLEQGAQAVADRLGLSEDQFAIAWQSAGATNDEWRGPDICTLIRDVAQAGRFKGIVVCPHGFTADHLEVAYDLDIQARGVAEKAGIAFTRARVLNDDRTVFRALAHWVALMAGTP